VRLGILILLAPARPLPRRICDASPGLLHIAPAAAGRLIRCRADLTYAGEGGYPPEWRLRERTSVIRPGHEYEVVIVTRLIGGEGHADAVLVNYTENGSQYVLRTITAFDVKHRPLRCSFA